MKYDPSAPRPEHVTCIAHDHADLKTESWCGRFVGMEFHFQGVDHAAENGRQNGRLVACAECVSAITAALKNGGRAMTAWELLGASPRRHELDSCSDQNVCNGFGTGLGSGWGWCKRCMFLQLIDRVEVPEDIKSEFGTLWDEP